MKSLRLAALLLAAVSVPAAADTLVDNVQGMSVDREGRVTRFTGIWIDDDGRVKQLLQRKDKRPPRTDFAVDGKGAVVMEGALGPLASTGATGHLAIRIQETGGLSRVNLVYDVGGYAKGGLAEAWAAPVDGVLGAQLIRLKKYLETGAPD